MRSYTGETCGNLQWKANCWSQLNSLRLISPTRSLCKTTSRFTTNKEENNCKWCAIFSCKANKRYTWKSIDSQLMWHKQTDQLCRHFKRLLKSGSQSSKLTFSEAKASLNFPVSSFWKESRICQRTSWTEYDILILRHCKVFNLVCIAHVVHVDYSSNWKSLWLLTGSKGIKNEMVMVHKQLVIKDKHENPISMFTVVPDIFERDGSLWKTAPALQSVLLLAASSSETEAEKNIQSKEELTFSWLAAAVTCSSFPAGS